MSIETRAFGGNGGDPFDIEAVKSLGFRSWARIDALLLNDSRYGGTGGRESTTLDFHPDEYIDHMVIRHWARIDAVEIHTNMGRSLSAGGSGGRREELTNIRVLGLGGNSGRELDSLRVRYIPNYTPATLLENNQVAIIDIVAPGEKIERSVSAEVSRLSASTRVMEWVFTADIGGESKALGNFIAKLTAHAGAKRTSRREIREEVKEIEQHSEKNTFSPPDGSVGLELVPVDVYREADGFVWLIPVAHSQRIAMRSESGLPTGAYDLTGVLAAQLPSMVKRREQRHGYHYYRSAD
jgi:hypothetical protein